MTPAEYSALILICLVGTVLAAIGVGLLLTRLTYKKRQP